MRHREGETQNVRAMPVSQQPISIKRRQVAHWSSPENSCAQSILVAGERGLQGSWGEREAGGREIID